MTSVLVFVPLRRRNIMGGIKVVLVVEHYNDDPVVARPANTV